MSNGFESNGAVPQFYCKKILQQCVHVKYIYICLKFKKKRIKKKIKTCLYNVALLHLQKSSYNTIPVFLAQSKNSYKIYYVFCVSFQYHRC